MAKKKFVVAKFIVFILFVSSSIYFFSVVNKEYKEFKQKEDKNMKKLNAPFTIRNIQFYEKTDKKDSIRKYSEYKAEYTSNQSVEINTNNNVQNDIKTTVSANATTLKDSQADGVIVDETANVDKYVIQIGMFRSPENIKLIQEKLNIYNVKAINVKNGNKRIIIDDITSKEEANRIALEVYKTLNTGENSFKTGKPMVYRKQ